MGSLKPLEVALLGLAGYVLAELCAEWARRKVWPESYPESR